VEKGLAGREAGFVTGALDSVLIWFATALNCAYRRQVWNSPSLPSYLTTHDSKGARGLA
jgi:hypothetical protein